MVEPKHAVTMGVVYTVRIKCAQQPSKLALLPPSRHLLDSTDYSCSLKPMTQKVLPIAAPAPRTDPPQAWTKDAGPSTRCGFFPLAATSGSQLCSAEREPALDKTTTGMVQPYQCPRSHRARGARKVGGTRQQTTARRHR